MRSIHRSKTLVITALYLFLSVGPYSFFANDTFTQFCSSKSGQIVKRYKCPKTSFPLLTPVCLFKSQEGVTQFTDGCTGPSGGHRELFTNSCIAHDLCYHHEPSSSGKAQRDCDLEFKESLLSACSQASDLEKCEKWAKLMYSALRAFGSLAFKCDDSSVSHYIY